MILIDAPSSLWYYDDGSHNRTYVNQDESLSNNPWSLVTPTLGMGTHRFLCQVTWEGGTQDSGAVRVSVLSAQNFGLGGGDDSSVRRRTYLQWLFSYLKVPYEWGGCWYGEKIGTKVGEDPAYEGYGTDCSGLVCCGAKRAGYNWHTGSLAGGWKYNCSGLMNVSYEISLADLQPGHIFLRTGEHPHVASVYEVTRADDQVTSVKVIHAAGDPSNRVRTSTWAPANWASYQPRALQYTP